MNQSAIRQILERARLPAAIAADKLAGRNLPRIVVLVVNNPCNLSCVYCFGEYDKRSASQDYTTEQILGIVDELHEMGTLYVTAHGGETLLRKDIGSVFERIKAKGMYLHVITNATLLPSRLSEVLAADSLCISLDGRQEGNDRARGAGAFRAAMDGIELIKSRTRIPLRVQATLTRHTKGDLRFLAELAREKGFQLQFSLLFQSTPNLKDLVLSPDEVRALISEIAALKEEGFPIFTSDKSLDIAMRWPYAFDRTTLTADEIPAGFAPIPCGFGRHKLIIDADGRAFPCFPQNKSFPALNVKEVGVRKAWEHVVAANRCVLCPFLTLNDWNYMMALDPATLARQAGIHARELL